MEKLVSIWITDPVSSIEVRVAVVGVWDGVKYRLMAPEGFEKFSNDKIKEYLQAASRVGKKLEERGHEVEY